MYAELCATKTVDLIRFEVMFGSLLTVRPLVFVFGGVSSASILTECKTHIQTGFIFLKKIYLSEHSTKHFQKSLPIHQKKNNFHNNLY